MMSCRWSRIARYSAPKATIATPVSRSTTKRTVVNNHYHGESGHSSGGGLSMTDYVMLHSLTNHNNSPTYINGQPGAAGAPTMVVGNGDYDAPAIVYQEETHYVRNFFLFLLGFAVVACIAVGIVHYLESEKD